MLSRLEQKEEVMTKRLWVGWAGFLLALFLASSAHAAWQRLFTETFDADPASRWTYVGVSNVAGQALMKYDVTNQCVSAEWDQANAFADGDPNRITNSIFSAPLDRALTDRDTFRFGATLRVTPGTIPDTLEFYQIATFGLYGSPAEVTGADRLQSDNFLFPPNTNLVRDANNLIEFDYFINNDSFGFNPFIQGTLIAAMPTNELDSSSYVVTGTGTDPLFNDTDMGADNYLPEDTNLYVEVTYYGSATGTMARRVYTAVYTDVTRTNLLSVNGVPMYYWTRPAATNRSFNVDHLAIVNYAAVNFTVLFGGSTPDGAGAGELDDLYVDLALALGGLQPSPDGILMSWASISGRTYSVFSATNPTPAAWTTSSVVVADGNFLAVTNFPIAPRAFWTIRLEPSP